MHNLLMPSASARRRTQIDVPVMSPAAEAWSLLFGMLMSRKETFVSIAAGEGLRPSDVRSLLSLEEPLPMREVAGIMACDPSTLTGVVDRLEEVGFVERRPDKDDRRVKMIATTRAGVAARERVLAKLQVPPEEFLRLTATEQRQLRDLIRKAVGEDA
jgi:DNA-binding MarR family transcriptional regulator